MKKRTSTVILILIFLVGLSLLLYPTMSDYWNSLHQSQAIGRYTESVEKLDKETYEKLLSDAVNYNRTLLHKENRYDMSEEEQEEYESLLDISGTGIMGYVEIPVIDCSLPVYHGTDEAVLQIAIGHIAGTSLPVGGEGTHCVISGHRGLPSARLFTDLDKLTEGDTFLLHVLDETLTYEVDQILIVNPSELNALEIEEDKDYCTLVTCTPYGINTHRLLVRGHRIANTAAAGLAADAVQIEPVTVASLVAALILILLFAGVLVRTRTRKNIRKKKRRNLR